MEPWLARRYSHLAPIPRFLCCSLELSLADVRKWTEPCDDAQIWIQHGDAGSIGFQLRHLAGSVDRLITYAREESLTEEQLAFLRSEAQPGESKSVLLTNLEQTYSSAMAIAAKFTDFEAPRFVGRQRLETPLGVLLAHIAEHSQRHTGQLIVLCKFAYSSYR